MHRRKKRKTIGILVSGITDPFSVSLIRGISQAGKDQDVDILIFPGKFLDRDLSGLPDIAYEYQFNTIYSYPALTEFDGLIISANSISCHTTVERMKEFIDSFRGIPVVLASTQIDGYPCIGYSNASAIEEGLSYLIEEEGCRHICLLSGPAANTDVTERMQIYQEVLRRHGLKCEPRMYEHGDFETSAISEQAMENLLQNNPEIDAVFCLNDYMAMSAYTVLKRHGIRPGDEIKVLGYDNVPESSFMDPPLTTIGADPIFLGKKAFQSLWKIMSGEHLNSIALDAKLVWRKSLGWNYVKDQRVYFADDHSLRSDFEGIYYRYIYEHTEQENEAAFRKFEILIKEILNSVQVITDTGKTIEEIMKAFDAYVNSDVLPYMDTEAMLRLVDRITSESVRSVKTEGVSFTHADIPLIIPELYRCLVQTEGRRSGRVNRRKHTFDSAKKSFVKKTLNFRHGTDYSYQMVLGCLGWAGITEGCLYIFENPVMHLEGETFTPPEKFLKKAYILDGEVTVLTTGRQKHFLREPLIPRELSAQCRTMMVAPLYFSEEMYGLFLCNISETLFTEGEFIINQLGTAVRMLHLLAENEAIQQQMEEQMTLIHTMNIELDTLSKKDELTGILNRRGFMESAAAFMKNLQPEDADCLIGYIDMDNLKVVNDRFGHDEGDFALKTIAQILTQILPKKNTLLGRIGGDEYVFLTSERGQDAEKLKEALQKAFADFNEKSSKPFNVTVSTGICTAAKDQTLSLEDALSYADKELYAAKQVKNRNILKS